MPYLGVAPTDVFATLDLNGQQLILDADADTSITADTDDQIDIRLSGADDFQFTANTFTVLSGSTLTVASGATIANSGTASGFVGAVTAINNATANELVTIGATTTELDAEAKLTFTGTVFTLGTGTSVVNNGTWSPYTVSTGKSLVMGI